MRGPNLVDVLAAGVFEAYKHCFEKPALGDYAQQSQEQKERNRNLVLHLPKLLSRVGLSLVPAHPEVPHLDLGPALLEKLAEMEHQRWLMENSARGIRYGPVKRGAENPYMLPWRALAAEKLPELPDCLVVAVGEKNLVENELPEEVKQKNICFLEKIFQHLQKVGFTIVRLSREAGRCVIGVTGHRILMELPKLEAGIATALHRIEMAFTGQALTLLSPLAEGADRLVARQVLARPGAGVIAILPLEKADYLTDFEHPESRREFLEYVAQAQEVVHLPPAPSREESYKAAGRYVLDHSEVLLAVWDGREAQGEGGTGGVVAAARQRKMPLAWVHAGNRKPGTEEPTTLGEAQGCVTFENFPA